MKYLVYYIKDFYMLEGGLPLPLFLCRRVIVIEILFVYDKDHPVVL